MENFDFAVKTHSEIIKERLTTDEKLSLLKAQEQFLLCQLSEEDKNLNLFTSELDSLTSSISSLKESLISNYHILITHKESLISSLVQKHLSSKEQNRIEKLEHNFLASFKVDHSTYHNQLKCKECKSFPSRCKYC
jgi:hypothetical protein